MKTLVLAAGMSTRIAAYARGLPKPLLPVGGIPVLHRNLRWLAGQGIREAFVNLHFGAKEIKASVGDGSRFGLRVHWSEEPQILGTAGAAKKLQAELTADADGRFLVVYGDNVLGFDLKAFLAAHEASCRPIEDSIPPPIGTLAVFNPAKNLRTGIAGGYVVSDSAGRITEFVEGAVEPPRRENSTCFVNAGCYLFENAVLDFVCAPPLASDWARQIFPMLLNANVPLRSFVIDGYCLGIDTPEAYARAEAFFASGKIR